MALQFILEHLALPLENGGWSNILPPALDVALVEAKVKSKSGALAFNTKSHRLSVLSKWLDLNKWPSPSAQAAVKNLLREARKPQSHRGSEVRKKTTVALELLQALLATWTDSVRGIRDRALTLMAWSSGGHQLSDSVVLTINYVR